MASLDPEQSINTMLGQIDDITAAVENGMDVDDAIQLYANLTIGGKQDYDFGNDADINSYLETYTDIDRETLDTATSLRMEEYEPYADRYSV